MKPDNTPKVNFVTIPEGIQQVTCMTLSPSKNLMLVGELASNPEAECNQPGKKMDEQSSMG
jgi:hypothetical protein